MTPETLRNLIAAGSGAGRARVLDEELLAGMLRVGVPKYPPAAFREAVANALIHRDYVRFGAVHVQWYKDRIEISSPGGFPEGVGLDNLLVASPRPRDRLLAEAFKRAGIVGRTRPGIRTIFYEQLRNGRPAPSYERSDGTGVVLVLPGGQANLSFVRLLAEESRSGRDLELHELLVLNHLLQGSWVTCTAVPEAPCPTLVRRGRFVNVFRIHIRPGGGKADRHLSWEYCKSNSVLGVGWNVGQRSSNVSWQDCEKLAAHYSDIHVVRYIRNNVSPGDLVWTRDPNGAYYLARLTSGWRYLAPNQDAIGADIVNVFDVKMHPVAVDEVPGKVVSSFVPKKSMQRIEGAGIALYSQMLWNDLDPDTPSHYPRDFQAISRPLCELMTADQVEDLVLLYLQSLDWFVVPTSRQRYTMAYESYLIHGKTGMTNAGKPGPYACVHRSPSRDQRRRAQQTEASTARSWRECVA